MRRKAVVTSEVAIQQPEAMRERKLPVRELHRGERVVHKRFLFFIFYFFKDFIYSFLERGKRGEIEGEKHKRVVVSHAPSTGDLACNPGMCPDWESNWRPFHSQAVTQSAEPHKPGPFCHLANI